MTAALIIGIFAVICSSATACYVAVMSRQSVSDAFRALERHEIRHQREVNKLLDRLMAKNWEEVVAMRSIEEDQEGGFFPPGQDEEGEVEVDDGKWGHLSTVRERLGLIDTEQSLVEEDFEPSGDPRRAAE